MSLAIIASAALVLITAWAIASGHRHAMKLEALRRNAFITNEKGHRVRYVNASPEARTKAEQ